METHTSLIKYSDSKSSQSHKSKHKQTKFNESNIKTIQVESIMQKFIKTAKVHFQHEINDQHAFINLIRTLQNN